MADLRRKTDLSEAVRCCQRSGESDVELLHSLVPSKISPNAIAPSAHLYSLTRTNVPLLCIAAAFGSLEAARYLVASGAKIDQTDCFRWTAVHWAAFAGKADVLRLLLESGGRDVAMRPPDPLVAAPLVLATRYGKIDSVQVLVGAGVGLAVADAAGRTALHLACSFAHTEIARFLLQSGAPFDVVDTSQRTPLHYASWFGCRDIVDMLVEKGPRGETVNTGDKNEDTPLHLACEHHWVDVVKSLLRFGADPKKKNAQGKTPEDIAEAQDRSEILELLQRQVLSSSREQKIRQLVHDQQTLGRSLESLLKRQSDASQAVKSMKETVDKQVGILLDIGSKYDEMTRDLAQMVHEADDVLKELRAKKPTNDRFKLSRQPT
jgi:ankyrin repeat protein